MNAKRQSQSKGRTFTKDNYCAADLLHAAIDHLGSSRVLFERHPRCFDSAGYLAHLGFELIFKAVLLHTTGQFPGEHSFPKLLSVIKSAGVDFPFDDSQHHLLDKLEEFKDLRYPIPSGSPSIGDQDWEQAEALFRWIVARIPTELRQHIQFVDQTVKFNRILMRKPKVI
ncbi:MAG TPA: HEPN domain-containing protein [Candidatus Binataceae bacterium]|nr:HEPN domain-containing protein [Candidatus Binataceae bacterium]